MKSNVLDGHVGESLRGGKNPMKVNHPVQVLLFGNKESWAQRGDMTKIPQAK